ncbi:MAG: PKD domain-containing protein [Bacteroidota bacterium]|jgi:alpha-tubulin suppressor-like RCC1 family protein/PKD repeat protein
MTSLIRLCKTTIFICATFTLLAISETCQSQTHSISASHVMVMCNDSLYNWGNTVQGSTLTPVAVELPTGLQFVQVNALSGCSYGLDASGSVWSWGFGTSGMPGQGNSSNVSVPSKVHGLNNTGFLENIKGIYGKHKTAYALGTDSTVYSWGSNTTGACGDGTYFNSKTFPVRVIDEDLNVLDSIVTLSGAPELGMALDVNGQIYVWGRDYYGEAGQGVSGEYYLVARKVRNQTNLGYLSNIKSIAAGTNFCLALDSAGFIWAWGKNNFGQLGQGNTNDTNLPVKVKSPTGNQILNNIVAIAAGDQFAMALDNTGEVYVWGSHLYGQLGEVFQGLVSNLPVLQDIGAAIQDIKSGGNAALITTSDNELVLWGSNIVGQMGNGLVSTYVPLLNYVLHQNANTHLSNIKQLDVGFERQVALLSNGTVWAWGDNAFNVASNDYSQSCLPMQVYDSTGASFLTNIKQIATGNLHNLALTNNGFVYGWGSTNNYVLANPTGSYYHRAVPIRNLDGTIVQNVRAVAAGANASVFLHNDSTVSWCGRLYINTLNSLSYPYPFKMKDTSGVNDLKNVISVACGFNNIYAVTADGQVWAVGNNDYGQLGLNDNSFNYGTRLVRDSSGITPLTGIVRVSAKQNSVLALTNGGELWAWGINTNGELGVGDTTFSYQMRKVLNSSGTAPLQNVKSMSIGEYHTLAIDADSTAWAWGNNVYGEVPNLSFEDQLLPVKVLRKDGSILTQVKSVHAGRLLSSFLLHDSKALSCGYNIDGQTGTRPTLGEHQPQLPFLTCTSLPPVAMFELSDTVSCFGGCIQFNDASLHFPSSWQWTVTGPENFTSSLTDPQLCFTLPGTYQVSLNAGNFMGSNSSTSSTTIDVLDNPTAQFTFSLDTATYTVSVINNSSGAESYNWSFGDGVTSTLSAPQHTYTQGGNYQLCLTSINDCSQSTACVTLAITTTSINALLNLDNKYLFPNPATDFIYLPADYQISSIGVYNSFGQLVLTQLAGDGISVVDLPQGIYHVVIETSEGNISTNFCKQ